MDESIGVNKRGPWEVEEITDDCTLYRQVHVIQTSGKPRRSPNESHFGLRPDEIYLSFNWQKHIDLDKNFKLIGISLSKKLDWLNIAEFHIFKYPVQFLRGLPQVKIVTHDPVYDEANIPSPIGFPNNRAHSAVYCIENDLKFRTLMVDYCKEKYDEAKCEFNKDSIKDEIEDLRKRANDIPFHKDWNFSEQ
ncbi:hypothetical protein [Pedobacter gandavensis]|uniref:Uncharacterized protein n=1 Tax=Pedobacter gandavensis TaxID=2679963 RepID=A0ABR6EU80_9SPHI|nr:hypothetical protein [Pedobacter gandavensis]MBB2148823.1 hypothetical protein [Pedobacter gandavensis]